jgi:MFS family permease
MAYWWTDRKIGSKGIAGTADAPRRFLLSDLARFGTAYWFLLALAVLWYAVIVAFRSTFSIKYFQHAHGLDLAAAGAMNSYVFLAALFTTPAFGWLCGKTGRYAPLLTFGASLLPLSIAIMMFTSWNLWFATVLIGISYSLVPAVLWPLLSKLAPPARFGTALGLMAAAQNIGIAGANFIAGELNDRSGAGANNPDGYHPMMLFFAVTSVLGFLFSCLLWLTAGRRRDEIANPNLRSRRA